MKNCPFCKNEVRVGTIKCPHCQRTLIEKDFRPAEPAKPAEPVRPKHVHRSWDSTFNNSKKYIPIIALGLLILIIFASKSKNSGSSSYVPVINTPSQNILEQPIPQPEPIPVKNPKDYISLNNGAILYKNSYYLNGDGELNIDNGTSSDAIAKLVNIATGKSIYTVYIKAGSKYQVKNIKDANYKLYFNLGNDWNAAHKAFNVNSSYETFEENFDFTTTDYQYSVFSVTLNPVVNGKAKTNDVNPQEFGNY